MRCGAHLMALLAALLLAGPVMAQDGLRPVTSDSRIKTFVYSPNDVYRLTTHHGYQLNIEFGDKELVQTVSIGDRVGWQVVPAGQRLFLQAMRDNAHTNMTIVTNKRAYQFDLSSASRDQPDWDDLVYVVRFYYPDDPLSARPPATPPADYPLGGMNVPAQPRPSPSLAPPMPTPSPALSQPFTPPSFPAQQSPALPSPSVQPAPAPYMAPLPPQSPATSAPTPNYAYSYTGDSRLAPRSVFDDGSRTYFLFDGPLASNPPVILALAPDGSEQAVPSGIENGYITIYQVHPRLILRKGSDYLALFNDRLEPPYGR